MMRPALPSKFETSVLIERTTDVAVVRNLSQRLAKQNGFSPRAQWEFAIAVSEAASNMVKYANGGRIRLSYCEAEGNGACLEFEAIDKGGGIAAIDLAIIDTVSEGVRLTDETAIHRRRGLGFGLGAIKRLVEDLQIENMEQGGVRIVGRKYRETST